MLTNIISADSHFNEPRNFYSDLHRKFGNIVPHLESCSDGDYWVSGDHRRPLSVTNRPGDRSCTNTKNIRYEDTEWFVDLDNRKHEVMMDGVGGEVLFPSGAMLFSIDDESAQSACILKLNDFMYSLDGFYQGVLILPDNPKQALNYVKNYNRAGTTFLLPLYSKYGPLFEDDWLQILEIICCNGGIVAFHAGTLDPHLRQLPGHDIAKSFVFKTSRLYFQAHHLILELILGGVFKKLPELNVIISELGASWVPYLSHRLIEGLDIYKEFDISESDVIQIFQNNFRFTVQFDFPLLNLNNMNVLTNKNIMFGSDFPHVESTYGFTKDIKSKILGQYGEIAAEQILFSNAKALFNRLN